VGIEVVPAAGRWDDFASFMVPRKPKSTYRALVNSRTIPHVDDGDAWSVVCFVVRPGFRRRAHARAA
jgi:hypothetical protein